MKQETFNTDIDIITHRFINADGTEFKVIKPVDFSYRNFVQQMHLVGPHEGMLEDVEWKIKVKGDYKWTEEQMLRLSGLVIVKEKLTRKNRFGKKITLRNQECAVWDVLQGPINDRDTSMFGLALCYMNPDARTLFSIEGIDF